MRGQVTQDHHPERYGEKIGHRRVGNIDGLQEKGSELVLGHCYCCVSRLRRTIA